MSDSLFIGWDVGAWLSKDGDALWVLDRDGNTLGKWHGNLGKDLQASKTAESFIDALLSNCDVPKPTGSAKIILAIDAPLALPSGFVSLVAGTTAPEHLEDAIGNPYLFRKTERFAAKHLGRNPLSPLQDQIGSQTTKILHFLAKFGLTNNLKGAWRGPAQGKYELSVIESYPAMCKHKKGTNKQETIRPENVESRRSAQLDHVQEKVTQDESDALLCAIIAWLYEKENGALHQAEGNDFSPSEGWIWFPINRERELGGHYLYDEFRQSCRKNGN